MKKPSPYWMTKMKDPKFLSKVRKYAIANDILNIPMIAKLETRAIKSVDQINDDKEFRSELSKLRHTVRDQKIIAGILKPDATPAMPTIHASGETLRASTQQWVSSWVRRLMSPSAVRSSAPSRAEHRRTRGTCAAEMTHRRTIKLMTMMKTRSMLIEDCQNLNLMIY